jgi:hypothetical protein
MGGAPIVDAGGRRSPPDDHSEREHDSDERSRSTDLARAEQVVDAGAGPAPVDAAVPASNAGPRDAGAMAMLDSGDTELQDAGELDASTRPREPGEPRGEPMLDASRPDMDPRWQDGGRGGHEDEHERE